MERDDMSRLKSTIKIERASTYRLSFSRFLKVRVPVEKGGENSRVISCYLHLLNAFFIFFRKGFLDAAFSGLSITHFSFYLTLLLPP